MKHTKSILFAAATAALALAAPMAGATPVDLRYQTAGNVFQLNPGGTNASTTVESSNTTGSFAAGAFALEQVPGGDSTALLPQKFLAFCLDLFNTVTSPVKYAVTDTPFVNNPLTGAQKTLIARLFDVFTGTGNMLTNTALTSPQSQAMQLALWEVVYETGPSFDVKTGAFQITNLTAGDAVVTAANSLLGQAVASLTDPDHVRLWNPVFLQAPFGTTGTQTSQNLVTVAPVPLPAGILMLMLAIGSLVGVRRLRKDAAA